MGEVFHPNRRRAHPRLGIADRVMLDVTGLSPHARQIIEHLIDIGFVEKLAVGSFDLASGKLSVQPVRTIDGTFVKLPGCDPRRIDVPRPRRA